MESSNKLKLKIITPHGNFFEDDVSIVSVKTSEGFMGILKGHLPTVASIQVSELHINWPGDKDFKDCAISGGLLYVESDSVSIITDAIEYKEDIDISRAEQAKLDAEAALRNKHDKAQHIKLEYALARAINRINVKRD